jgi:hypothetical protein
MIISYRHIVSLFLVADCFFTYAGEYDFDVSEYEKKAFEYSAILQFRPSLVLPNTKGTMWRLKYSQMPEAPNVVDTYQFIANPAAQFDKNSLHLFGSADFRIGYNRPDNNWQYSLAILEGYLKYQFNTNWSLLAGKKLYRWGRGYSYNPVAYGDRLKDLNDIEAAREGYYSAAVQFNKSIALPGLKNFSHEMVILPVYKVINKGYQGGDRHWLLNHSYFLVYNIDLDFYYNVAYNLDYSLGVSAAYNILTQWEIHGELSYFPQSEVYGIRSDSSLLSKQKNDIVQTIIGTRYLAPFNATFFLEYIYNGAGVNLNEAELWYLAAEHALENQNEQIIRRIRTLWNEKFNTQFLMQQYLYFKVNYPEPFTLLYVTPSVYSLVNIADKSFMAGIALNYTRFDALVCVARYIIMHGKDAMTEFGSKIGAMKFEVDVQYYF